MGYLPMLISVIAISNNKHSTCELCGFPEEDCFHACIKCPHAAALRLAMRDHWSLPKDEEMRYTGPEWFLLIVDRCSAQVTANLLMLMWRAWSVRNDVLHGRERISIDGSVVFLTRYMNSLTHVRQQDTVTDTKGKRTVLPVYAHVHA